MATAAQVRRLQARRSSPETVKPARRAKVAKGAGAASEWERLLAQLRPEAQALMNLLVEINCRLALEAYQRQQRQTA